MEGGPPEVVDVGSVRLRRWQPEDADALHGLIQANLDHLRPWIAWVAAEPLSLEERRTKIASWSARWVADDDFFYAILDTASGQLLGGCGLYRRIAGDGLELGYWIRGDRTGQGHATDAVRALVKAAFSMDGTTHVELHHDAANTASRRVAEKVGFSLVEARQGEVTAPAEIGVDMIWRLDRDPGAG